jgi:hypothetical protein
MKGFLWRQFRILLIALYVCVPFMLGDSLMRIVRARIGCAALRPKETQHSMDPSTAYLHFVLETRCTHL